MKAVNKLGPGLKSSEASLGNFLGTVASIAQKAAIAVGAALTAMTAASIYTGAQFEQAMANTTSMFIATAEGAEQLNTWRGQLEGVARELGASTTFTATEAANAMYSLASGGMEAGEIMAATESILHLAGATLSGLGEAAELTMSTLRQFGLAATDADRVVNVFAAGIQNSMLTMERLYFAMQYTGPVAAQLGLELEELTGALMLLHNAGLKGSLAGTGMRQVMVRLTRPVAELERLLEGVSVQGDGFAAVLDKLNERGLRADQVARMFGQRTLSAISTLLAAGAEGFEEMTSKITGTTAAADAYALQMDTVRSQWIILMSAMQETKLVIFDVIKEDLMSLIQWLIEFVSVSRPVVAEIYEQFSKWLPKAFNYVIDGVESVIFAIKYLWATWDKYFELMTLWLFDWYLNVDIATRNTAVSFGMLVTLWPRAMGRAIERSSTVATKGLAGLGKIVTLSMANMFNPTISMSDIVDEAFSEMREAMKAVDVSYDEAYRKKLADRFGLSNKAGGLVWAAEWTKHKLEQITKEIESIGGNVQGVDLRAMFDLPDLEEFTGADFDALMEKVKQWRNVLKPPAAYVTDAWGGMLDDIESMYFDSWDIIWDTARTGSEKWKAIYASMFSSIGKMLLKLLWEEVFIEGLRMKWREWSAAATEEAEKRKQRAMQATTIAMAQATAAQIGLQNASTASYEVEGAAAEKTAAQKFFASFAGLPFIGWALAVAAIVGMIAMLSKMHTGGMVGQIGSNRETARVLQEGEYVMPVAQTRQFYPILEQMRNGETPAFSAAGVGGGSAPSAINVNVNVGAGSLLLANDEMAVRRLSEVIADDIDKRVSKRRSP
jgi:TP901 family phage tail tape measure protein